MWGEGQLLWARPGPGRELGVSSGQAPHTLLVQEKAGPLGVASCPCPLPPTSVSPHPCRHKPSPGEHPHSCTGRSYDSRRHCLIPSAEQGGVARKGKGRPGGGRGLRAGEGRVRPDAAGWRQSGKSRALGAVRPTPLQKHCFLSFICS